MLLSIFFLNSSFYIGQKSQEENSSRQEICIEVPEGLNLRKHPRLSAARIGIIPRNERVQKLGKEGELMHLDCQIGHWVKVEYRGVKGYVFLSK